MRLSRTLAFVAGFSLLGGVLAAPASAASSATDQAVAQAGLLTATDFGAGWISTPYDSSQSPAANVASIPSCKKLGSIVEIVGNRDTKGVRAHSPAFSEAGIAVDNNVALLPTAKAARKAMAAVTSPAMRACVKELGKREIDRLKQSDPATAKLLARTSTKVTSRTVTLPADQAAGIQLAVTLVSKDGRVAQEVIDFTVARDGRALSAFSVSYAPAATSHLPDRAFTPSLTRLRTAITTAPA